MLQTQVGPAFLFASGLSLTAYGLGQLAQAWYVGPLGKWMAKVLPGAGAVMLGVLFTWSGYQIGFDASTVAALRALGFDASTVAALRASRVTGASMLHRVSYKACARNASGGNTVDKLVSYGHEHIYSDCSL
jgi:hypothetical protein